MSSNWIYKGRPIEDSDIPVDSIGFIYRITHKATGRDYIGKKLISTTRRKKISKREKTATKTRKTYKTEVKDSGWKLYWSSSVELKEDVQKYGEDAFHREILEFCWSKKQLGYKEVEYQIKEDMLIRDTYVGNVNAKWYRRDLIKPIDNGSNKEGTTTDNKDN